MAVYSIKDLEMLSGIKAHTLRIWEQRYHIICPKRTPTNIRYYEEDDLRHLLHISILNKNGYKISRIASMTPGEIAKEVNKLSAGTFEDSVQIDALTLSMMELDEAKFETILASNIRTTGFEHTMQEVVYPFLNKLSVLWLTGSVHAVQENFITNLVRQKLIAAIDSIPLSDDPARSFILYLPEGESQELSLLFLHYLLKKRGMQVLYLGQNISLSDLAEASAIFPSQFLFTIISESFIKQSVHQYLEDLRKVCPDKQVLVTGYQIFMQGIQSRPGITVLRELEDIQKFLTDLSVQNGASAHLP
ncbi:MAG: MerR family transcriptional regulator [Saprospiraceae bacterium]|nr:MerR family transcriptional regulator [Saprospiraceae bacterium]